MSIYIGQKSKGKRFYGVMNPGSSQELIERFSLLEKQEQSLILPVSYNEYNVRQGGCFRAAFIQMWAANPRIMMNPYRHLALSHRLPYR